MKELCEKYPALVMPKLAVTTLKRIKKVDGMSPAELVTYYKYFKANISCIGLNPEEYETCINWFCEVMEY
jgi:hypothetical protein